MSMQTNDLIQSLTQGLRPVPPLTLERRIINGILLGAAVSGAIILLGLGLRPDLLSALKSFAFWMKAVYTLSFSAGALAATMRLARPDGEPARWFWLLAIPVLLLAGVAASELAWTPPQDWLAMWLGHSWRQCPLLLLLLSAPIFLGLLWAFTRLAPTRLMMAGAMAGLASGGTAALLYCLHCPEVSACFVLTWYSLGIGLAAAVGAVAGPRLLRW
jgi:hypothetical protein